MPVSAGIAGLGDLLGTLFTAAPEVAAAAAPAEVAAADVLPAAATLTEGVAPFAIPGFTVTPEAAAAAAAPELGATIGPGLAGTGLGVGETAAGVAPVAAGSSVDDILGGLGAGSLLGITPALAAGGAAPAPVSPVAAGFQALGPTTTAGGVTTAGTAAAPAAAPSRLPGSAGVGSGGAGGAQASGHDLSGSALDTGAATADPTQAGYEGQTIGQGAGAYGVPGTPTNIAPPSTIQAPGAEGFFGKNAGLLALLGAGLGGELLAPKLANTLGLTNVPQQGPLQNIATQAGGISQQEANIGAGLQAPLTTGTLPPEFQAQVDQALSSANAATKSKFDSLGLSGSTMEQSALADNAQNSQIIKANLEQTLFTSGTQAIQEATANLNLADTVYTQLMDAQVAQDNQLQQSIGQFASALALGSAIGSAKA